MLVFSDRQYDFSILTEKAKACTDDSLLFWLCGLVNIPTTTKGTLFPFLWTEGPYATQAVRKLMISLPQSPSYRQVVTTHGSNKPLNSIKVYVFKSLSIKIYVLLGPISPIRSVVHSGSERYQTANENLVYNKRLCFYFSYLCLYHINSFFYYLLYY